MAVESRFMLVCGMREKLRASPCSGAKGLLELIECRRGSNF
jgi:hypothetical protein